MIRQKIWFFFSSILVFGFPVLMIYLMSFIGIDIESYSFGWWIVYCGFLKVEIDYDIFRINKFMNSERWKSWKYG